MALTARMVTIDCADPASLAKFWAEAARYELLADYDGWYIVLTPSDPSPSGGASPGGGLRLGLQKVPEEKVGKNRVHIDWEADDRAAEVRRLVGIGATVLAEHVMPEFAWTVLADPVGNEFCVTGRE